MDRNQPEHPAEKHISRAPLLIRADATTQMGSGHIMRCLALAQAWQVDGGSVMFMSVLPETLRARLETERMAVRPFTSEPGTRDDVQYAVKLARELNTPYVVVDGYHFGAEYQRWLKDAGLRVLFLDDNGHAAHYYADWVLNQNIHADEHLYRNRESQTRLLLGTRYAMLRREFWSWRGWQRAIPEKARNILVTMGGSDPDNVTLKVLRAIREMDISGLDVRAVIGGANPHYATLQAEAERSAYAVRLERSVNDMPEVMAWADVAISAGGSTCWELAFMGLPSVLVVLAENQRALVAGIDAGGGAISLGGHSNLSRTAVAATLASLIGRPEQRAKISRMGRQLVDARGAERVVKALRKPLVRLRPVSDADCRLVFEWANDPSVRAVSFSPQAIRWETHIAWFQRQLADDNVLFFLGETESGEPIGQVRFEVEGTEATISVSLAGVFRGKGYGSAFIEQASWYALQLPELAVIHAYIKPSNVASKRAFANAGYVSVPASRVSGQPVIHMRLERTYG